MTKTQKRTLHIWIGCSLVGCMLFLPQRLLNRYMPQYTFSTSGLAPTLTPMVVPGNTYHAVSPRTGISDHAVRGELALNSIKGNTEEWEAQGTPQAIVAQLPTSYMTGSPTGLSSPKQKERMIRSVGGGQTFNASSTTSVTPSIVTGQALAQATISLPTPKMSNMRSRNISNITEPFSEEMPFADMQRAAPGSGSAVGAVTPIGDCPWTLLPLFFFYIYRRQRKATT